MSRCFSFLPPGNLRKAGVESAASVDILKQDKHREKKDKKGKDREKREGKERKENDQSDEKHRDKKEKKDKHRDKKDKNKEKEKEREKDRSSSSNDKKLALHAEGTNGEMTPKEKGPLPSLLPAGQVGDGSIWKKERDRHRNSTPDGKKHAGQNAEKIILTNNKSSRDIGDKSKFLQELEMRLRNDRSSGTQLAEKFVVVEKKKNDGIVEFMAQPAASIRQEGKEWNKKRRDNEQKVNRANGNLKVQNFGGAVQSRVKEVRTPLEQNIESEIEWREKFRGREAEDKCADKWKEKAGEKDQGKVRLGQEWEEEKMREKSESARHIDQEKLKLSRKNDLLCSRNRKDLHQPVKEPDKTVAGIGSVIMKRKETEANGFLHVNENRANKLQKQTLASYSTMENGKTLVASTWSEPTDNSNNILKAEEDRKINGVRETRPMPPVSSPSNIQSSTSQANSLLAEVPLVKPPHPDSKHLHEILSRVPRVEELPKLDDDQEWLFDIDRQDSKKSKIGHMVIDGMPQVWGESLHIESADIYALPYVIPY